MPLGAIHRALLVACAAAALVGCAAQPAAPAVTLLSPASRLAVLQLSPGPSDDALRRVFHAGEKQVPAEALAADRRALQQQVQVSLQQALGRARLPVLASAQAVPVGASEPMQVGQPMDAASLAALRAWYPADAYLRVRVTDYGLTPASWKSAYITFEVVTTLAIGTALYVHKATRPLAGIYLIEEGVEEYSEGYAGWWLLNRLSRPVRIEADLVDGSSGRLLWRDSATGMAAWSWGHLWHMDDATRDGLLQESIDRMTDELVIELEGK